MMKFNREEGLTLIELLITIAVLAIVAAIAVPVVTNVVSSTDDRALEQTQSDVDAFTAKYDNVGEYTFFDGSTDNEASYFEGFVDLDGNGSYDNDEKIEELVLDSKYTVTADEEDGELTGTYTVTQ